MTTVNATKPFISLPLLRSWALIDSAHYSWIFSFEILTITYFNSKNNNVFIKKLPLLSEKTSKIINKTTFINLLD